MIDIDAVRADTPACESILHFNNAGAALVPTPVFEAQRAHLELERDIGGYEAADRAAAEIAAFYSEFASLLKVRSDEIAAVENATRGWDMAFYSLRLGKGDRVLTHDSEYASNYLALLQQGQRRGFAIDRVPSDDSGQVDVDALESMIRPTTRLIALTHVPTQGGLVNPAEAVGAVARRNGLLYLLDACQSVGQLDVDVRRIGCHMLSGTGRKFLRGPRGTGFLYVSNDLIEQLDPPFIDLHSASWDSADEYRYAAGARRFENWESNVAGRIGLARAVRYARELGLSAIEARVKSLARNLREGLASMPGCSVHDLGVEQCGIVTLQKDGEDAAALAARLRQQRINVSVTGLPSAQLDFSARGLRQLLRASVHYYNTDAEIARFLDVLSD